MSCGIVVFLLLCSVPGIGMFFLSPTRICICFELLTTFNDKQTHVTQQYVCAFIFISYCCLASGLQAQKSVRLSHHDFNFPIYRTSNDRRSCQTYNEDNKRWLWIYRNLIWMRLSMHVNAASLLPFLQATASLDKLCTNNAHAIPRTPSPPKYPPAVPTSTPTFHTYVKFVCLVFQRLQSRFAKIGVTDYRARLGTKNVVGRIAAGV